MNKAVKTHWKLAWRAFGKAVKVTLQTFFAMLRAKRYLLKVEDDIAKRRALFATLQIGGKE